MMTQLIKKNDFYKLEFLRYIYIHQPITVKQIMQVFDLPRSTAKRTLAELTADLDRITADQEIVVKGEDYTYQLEYDDEKHFNQIFLKLKVYYCDNSIPFSLLKLLLFNEVTTISAASETLSISVTHCYRSIVKINEVLSEFDVAIENNSGNFSISGREETIRLICFEMLTKTYLCIQWPFSSMSIADVKAQIEPEKLRVINQLSTAEKEKALYVYMIRLKRFKFRENLIHLSATQKDILHCFLRSHDVTQVLSDSSRQVELGMLSADEVYFTNFFSRLFFPKIDSDENRKQIGADLIQLNNRYSHFISDFIERFMQQFDLIGSTIFDESIYFTSICFLFDYYFHVDASPLVDVPHPSAQQSIEYGSSLYKATSDFVTTFIQEQQSGYPELLSEFNNQVFLIDLLYSIVITHRNVQLNIYIAFAQKSLTTEHLLGNKLHQLFNQKTLKIVNDVTIADLIISDSPEKTADYADFFYFEDFGEPLLWEKLVKLIQDKIIRKLYSSILG